MGEKIMKKAIYPGTFDPVTNGHIDIIKRSASIFDELIIAVNDDNKNTMFNMEERVQIIKDSIINIKNVKVKSFTGLLMNFCESQNTLVIIRGLRVLSDFEFEFKMALMNRGLNNKIDTLFFMPNKEYIHISSTLIKEVAILGGEIKEYVPKHVISQIKNKINVEK